MPASASDSGSWGVLSLGYFRLAAFDDAWMALCPVALAVVFAAIPYRHGPTERISLGPWRSFVFAAGLALCVGVLVGGWAA